MTRVREIPSLEDIRAARTRISSSVLRIPLVRLAVEEAPAEIHLKLENLQPIGSFKLRGAANAMRRRTPEELRDGVVTPSAGNMAQGVAWNAKRMGVPCSVVVPDHAPVTKLDAIERLGATIIKVPFETWWEAMMTHRFAGAKGLFIHPASDPDVIAGNGTIGIEILEDLPDVDAILVPYGGGGLSVGIAAAVRALAPGVKVLACEVETAAPLKASLDAGAPTAVEYIPSFVDGIGGRNVLEEMWPLARRLLEGSLVVTLREVAETIRLLATRNRVIAEGAGAVPVAAALSGKAPGRKVVCVVSGGNIDPRVFAQILMGELPPVR